MGAAGALVTIDVSGGDSAIDPTSGTRLGSGGEAQQSFESILIGRSLNSGFSSGDISVNANLVADGGAGDDGGNGGIVAVVAIDADVSFESGSISADGGLSQGQGYAVALTDDGTDYAFEDIGGGGGIVTVQSDGDAVVDADISARGGDSLRGLGGNGGRIALGSVEGALVSNTGLFDVSAGDGVTSGDTIELDPTVIADEDFEGVPFVEGLHEIQGGGNGGIIVPGSNEGPVTLLGGSVASAGVSGNPAAEDGVPAGHEVAAVGHLDARRVHLHDESRDPGPVAAGTRHPRHHHDDTGL